MILACWFARIMCQFPSEVRLHLWNTFVQHRRCQIQKAAAHLSDVDCTHFPRASFRQLPCSAHILAATLPDAGASNPSRLG